MTKEQWKNPLYRKFKNRKAFVIYYLNDYAIQLSEVEAISSPVADIVCKNKFKISCKLYMKSGTILDINEKFDIPIHDVKNTILGFTYTAKKYYTINEITEFIRTSTSSANYFYKKILDFRVDFRNSVCVNSVRSVRN